MRYVSQIVATTMLLSASLAWGQAPQTPAKAPTGDGSSLTVAPTTEMWFYDQELRQRYSPQLAVRRKAEFETSQRMNRMAARDWFGVSNARPSANPTPVTGGGYSPTWTSGHRETYHWAGHTTGTTVIVPSTRPVYNIW